MRCYCASTAQWLLGNALMNCGRGCGPSRKLRTLRSGHPSQKTKSTIRQWSHQTLKCDPKKLPTELKNTKIEKRCWFAGSYFLRSIQHWRIVPFGSGSSHCEVFLVSLTYRTLARNDSLARLGFFVGLWAFGFGAVYDQVRPFSFLNYYWRRGVVL